MADTHRNPAHMLSDCLAWFSQHPLLKLNAKMVRWFQPRRDWQPCNLRKISVLIYATLITFALRSAHTRLLKNHFTILHNPTLSTNETHNNHYPARVNSDFIVDGKTEFYILYAPRIYITALCWFSNLTESLNLRIYTWLYARKKNTKKAIFACSPFACGRDNKLEPALRHNALWRAGARRVD